jgi:glutamate 5-kinase
MKIEKRPKHLPQIQALAAIGQCRLMSLWDQLFGHVLQPIAQILLTRNDIADRTQYQNAQNTFFELLNMGVIPIVNENDTLAVSEIKFGDNDTLSAITAGMVQADYLFLMTDVDCLYDKNPRSNPDAKPITVVEDMAELEADVSSAGSALGTGGMTTKIVAAKLATSAGVTTVITRSSKPGNISAIIKDAESHKIGRVSSRSSIRGGSVNGDYDGHHLSHSHSSLPHSTTPPMPPVGDQEHSEGSTPLEEEPVPLHTRFLPVIHRIRDRRFWILHGLTPHGTIYIDHGAWQALSEKAGLLPAGVVDVDGTFDQQEGVRLVVVKRIIPRPSSRNSHRDSASAPPGSGHISTHSHHSHHSHHHPTTHHNDTHTIAPIPDRTSLYERAHAGLVHSLSNSALPAQGLKEHTQKDDANVPLYETEHPPPFEVGRAVVNYSASEVRQIMGLHSSQINETLGYADSEYIALRENIAFFDAERSRPTTPSLRAASVTGDD